jgi:hypothetical protein
LYADRSTKPEMQPSTWEFAEYVTADGLRAMLGDRFARGSVVAGSDTPEGDELTRAIVKKTGAFVALVNASGQLMELYDRTALVDKVARHAAEQVTSG